MSAINENSPLPLRNVVTSCYVVGMLKAVFALIIVLTAPVGLFLTGFLLKLGLESCLETYGVPLTIIAGLGPMPVLVAIGFLFDRQEQRKQR